jgi:hypothetical protein
MRNIISLLVLICLFSLATASLSDIVSIEDGGAYSEESYLDETYNFSLQRSGLVVGINNTLGRTITFNIFGDLPEKEIMYYYSCDDGDTYNEFDNIQWVNASSPTYIQFSSEFTTCDYIKISRYHHYSYGKTEDFVASLGGPHINTTLLGLSPEGRNLWVIRITNESVPIEQKRIVFLITKQHIREETGYAIENLTAYLNSTDAINIRNEFVWYIVPLMDPDRLYEGDYFYPSEANNMNRQWNLTSNQNVELVKAYMDGLDRIDFFLDFHAWTTREDHTLLGFNSEASKNISDLFYDFQSVVSNRFSKGSIFTGLSTSSSTNLGIAKNYVGYTYKPLFSTTIEFGLTNNSLDFEGRQQMGQDIAISIYDALRINRPIFHAPFNEGTGVLVGDYSGNGLEGTIYGALWEKGGDLIYNLNGGANKTYFGPIILSGYQAYNQLVVFASILNGMNYEFVSNTINFTINLVSVHLLEPEISSTKEFNPVNFKANYTSKEGFKIAYLWTNHTGTWENHTTLTGNNSDYAQNTTYDNFDSGTVYPRGWEIVVGDEDVLLTNVTWLAGSGYNATISQNNFGNVLQTSLITDNLSTHYLPLDAGGVYQITTDSPNFSRLYDIETRNSTNGWFQYKHYNLGPFFRHNIDTVNVQKDGEIEGSYSITDGFIEWNVQVCTLEDTCNFITSNSTFTMDDLGVIVYINSPLNQTYSTLPILLNLTTEGQAVSSILYNLNGDTNVTYTSPINLSSFDSQENTLNVYANYSITEISYNSTTFTLTPIFVNLVSPANGTLTTSVSNLFDFKVFNIAENYISNISIFMFIDNQWSVQNTTSFSYDTPISSIEDLLLMNGSSDSFVLSKDLDFCDEDSYDDPLNGQANITALCKDNLPQPGWVPLNTFTGQLEGNMHTIKNFYINNSPSINDLGLFKTISNSTIQNLIFEDPIVVGVNNYGGSIAGSAADRSYVRNVIIINPYFSGSYYLGGLVGRFRDSQMHECQVQRGYIFANSQYVGGLVGQISDLDYQGSSLMTNSFSSADVENNNFGGIGGAAGLAYDTTINNSYATGDVIDGNSQCGGLVGWAFRNLTVQNSYATGNVTCGSSTRKGGLIGFVGPSGGGGDPDTVAIDSFYDTNTTGQNDTGYGTPKTTIEMQNISTFTNWDIATIGSFVDQTWYINETNDYPRLYFEQRDIGDLYFSIYSDVPEDASTLWRAQTCLSTGECFDSEEEWIIEHANSLRLLAEGTSLTNETFKVELGSIIEITYDRRNTTTSTFLLAFLDVFYPLLGANTSNGTGTTIYNLTIDRFFKYLDYDAILLNETTTDTSFDTVASFDNSGKTRNGAYDRFWYAQRFTTPSEGNLTVNQVILSLEPSDATPEPFSFNVSIRNATATSADYSSGSINMSILEDAYVVGGLFTIDIAPITLNASTNYTIVMNCEDCYVLPTQQIVNIHSSGSSDSLYGGFIFSEDSGVSWDPPVETTEFIFYVGYNESFTSQVYENNTLNVTMHQHDEVINVTLDSVASNKSIVDLLIYKVNSTELDKAYIGEIDSDGNVFNTQFTDLSTEDYVDEVELVYSSDSNRRVYFLIDRYSSILGLLLNLSFVTQGFQFYDSFDTENYRDPILSDATIQGQTVMPEPSSILDFTYDNFSGSFNSTKWFKYPDNSGSETDFYSWSTTTTQTGGELRNRISVSEVGDWDVRQGISRNIQVNQINKNLLNIPTAESIELEFNFNNYKETYYELKDKGSIERCFAELRLFAGGKRYGGIIILLDLDALLEMI